MAKFLSILGLMFMLVRGGVAQESKNGSVAPYRIHTVFSVECKNYFDWQTVGLMHSLRKAGQPGPVTRLLSCTDEELKNYKGMHLAPTLLVPSMTIHPETGDWYPGINKPAGVLHWVKHSIDAENTDWVIILDADGLIRGPILPWELGAERGIVVSIYYSLLIGCDNILAKMYTKHPELCDKVGGFHTMHIDDLRAVAPLWLSKTEDVRGDKVHWDTKYSGEPVSSGWTSEMYGYAFSAAEVGLRHKMYGKWMLYPSQIPTEGAEPILIHYYTPFSVGNWSFNKLEHFDDSIVYNCGQLFPEPPYPEQVMEMESSLSKRDALFLSLECINTLNEALLLHHAAQGCPQPNSSKYVDFLRSKAFADMTMPKKLTQESLKLLEVLRKQEPENETSLEFRLFRKMVGISAASSEESNRIFSLIRLVIVCLWGFSVFWLGVVMPVMILRCLGLKKKSKVKV